VNNINKIANQIGALAQTAPSAGLTAFTAISKGGLDPAADVAAVLSSAAFVSDLWNQWTSHPAADARDFIANLKPKLAIADPYNRLVQVMAGDTKISHRAKDVSAKELVLWYRQNYPNDYMTLTPDQKLFFNKYLVTAASQATDVNQASTDYRNSAFTNTEINYNATPIQTASNILTNATTGTTNWILYGAVGLGLIILLSKK
jgi:hypothetical protein